MVSVVVDVDVVVLVVFMTRREPFDGEKSLQERKLHSPAGLSPPPPPALSRFYSSSPLQISAITQAIEVVMLSKSDASSATLPPKWNISYNREKRRKNIRRGDEATPLSFQR